MLRFLRLLQPIGVVATDKEVDLSFLQMRRHLQIFWQPTLQLLDMTPASSVLAWLVVVAAADLFLKGIFRTGLTEQAADAIEIHNKVLAIEYKPPQSEAQRAS